MKMFFILVALSCSSFAFAQSPIKIEKRLRSVEVSTSNDSLSLIVGAEICNGAFPTVDASATKIGTNAVVLNLEVYSRQCPPERAQVAKFAVLIEDQIKDLGLDPKTTNIYVQVR